MRLIVQFTIKKKNKNKS